ncbi:hypothetical protein [Crenobacter intestini]|uniref:Uncharacterized protein n=1 Tax=Crenobacter intestini TaxID=2563443 RepID=A0A4T0V6X0_9NEIS|nr:hypothetical protein [Crenobacter intestini]TIC87066.1 hypothetical protein E5K04_01210 [Crenobacter intestini]
MYDWNALWHQHAGYRTGYTAKSDTAEGELNALADELGARLIHPAKGPHDVAVYEEDGRFTLAGYHDGLQLLHIRKQELFDLTLHFVPEADGSDEADCPAPRLELAVDNLATGEHGLWRAPVTKDKQGNIWIGNRRLDEGLMPAMSFDELSFTDNSRFRDALYEAWQHDLPALAPEIEAWFDPALRAQAAQAAQAATASTEAPAAGDARTHEMLERYAEIIRREQLMLSRRFDDAELKLVATVLEGVHFEEAASCRGLWLAIEARILDEELDRRFKVDGEALLDKLKALSYTQEVALIEALAPAR